MGESTFCSDGNLLDTSTKDHLHYFEKDAFYNKGMGAGAHYYVCYDMGESTFCSDGNLLDTSTKDHLHYFEKDVSDYGIKG
ncbi:hypothetical protein TELCIR_11024 [Teladorsagia circumcincta]|uniref:Uncharacterized protein n=1 Tax=Teladorsagia circumcincta TaxID=45464 RepID=A0A2G9UAJ8_TELCI|nr:hypothetical protein TELCIR_11024 [Teladorsagia circumcincta]